MIEENQTYKDTFEPRAVPPYSIASLVLGIVSLAASSFGITLVLGILGLIYSNKGLSLYEQNPGKYATDGLLRAGKVTSIVGIVLSGLALLTIILVILFAVGMASWAYAMSDI